MNDPKGLFEHEQTPFEIMLNKWNTQLRNNELYKKLIVDTFDINSVVKDPVIQVKPIRQHIIHTNIIDPGIVKFTTYFVCGEIKENKRGGGI